MERLGTPVLSLQCSILTLAEFLPGVRSHEGKVYFSAARHHYHKVQTKAYCHIKEKKEATAYRKRKKGGGKITSQVGT